MKDEPPTPKRFAASCGVSNPASPNLFLPDLPFQKKTDPLSGNHVAGVLIGIVCVFAALADELGL